MPETLKSLADEVSSIVVEMEDYLRCLENDAECKTELFTRILLHSGDFLKNIEDRMREANLNEDSKIKLFNSITNFSLMFSDTIGKYQRDEINKESAIRITVELKNNLDVLSKRIPSLALLNKK